MEITRKRKPNIRIWLKANDAYLLVMPSIILLAFVFLGPALFNIVLSLFNVSLFRLSISSDTFVGLGNFLELLRDEVTLISLRNTTFWLTLATVFFRLSIGLIIALLLNASILRTLHISPILRVLSLVPWMTPPVVAVAAWRWLFEARYGAINQILVQAGILNQGIPVFARLSTVWGGIITTIVWRELPFVIISFLAGLQSIPNELYDAAKVDGASTGQVLRRVTLPLLRPVTVVVGLLITIWTFNNFLYVWLLTRGGPGMSTQVLATQMYEEAFINYRLGYGAAVGVFMSLVMLIFTVIYLQTVFRQRMEE